MSDILKYGKNQFGFIYLSIYPYVHLFNKFLFNFNTRWGPKKEIELEAILLFLNEL